MSELRHLLQSEPDNVRRCHDISHERGTPACRTTTNKTYGQKFGTEQNEYGRYNSPTHAVSKQGSVCTTHEPILCTTKARKFVPTPIPKDFDFSAKSVSTFRTNARSISNARAISNASASTPSTIVINTSQPPPAISPAATTLRVLPSRMEWDSDDSDNDMFPTPIVHNPKTTIPCLHTTSYTKSFSTKRVIACPYRKTLLSLLCRIRTDPTDYCNPTSPSSSTSRLQVYACFQQHWNPKLNLPLLTIAACCNTNISMPILSRTKPDSFELKFMCTTHCDQGTFTFEIPIYTTLANVSQPVVIVLGPYHPLPDSMISWLIKTAESNIPICWIKLWHLSPSGCMQLHNQGILQPFRPYFEAEIHILGLTGLRKMPNALNQATLDHPVVQLLDDADLGNVGYKKSPRTNKPKLDNTNIILAINRAPKAFPKTNATPLNYFMSNNTMVFYRDHSNIKFPDFDPQFYPPPYNHLTCPDEFPDPVLLQPGCQPFTYPLILEMTTFEDMVKESLRREPLMDPITTLMKYFNFNRDSVPKDQNTSFREFLALNEMSPNRSNGLCQFNSYMNGQNTGDRYLIHKQWMSIADHPCTKDTDKVTVTHEIAAPSIGPKTKI